MDTEKIAALPTIPPLITRHAGDAAFYWQQHDQSAHSPLVGLGHLREFDRLLDAHLDGLRVAGDAGWQAALAALQRWRKAPEVFVCATLALESAQNSAQKEGGERLEQTWHVVQTQPDRMLRGWIAALAWAPAAVADAWCTRWIKPDDIIDVPGGLALAVGAWRARALHSHPLQSAYTAHLPSALNAQHPALRAAGCRVVALHANPALLWPLLQDPERDVRAEAAIGLLGGGVSSSALTTHTGSTPAQAHLQVLETLWQATQKLCDALKTLSGWPRALAQHRLMRWVAHLALAAPLNHPGVLNLLKTLPTRLGLWLVLHHADPHHLPWVVQAMQDPEVARLAGWVWSTLTGVDLHSNGLALPPRFTKQAPRPTDIQDPGLLEPDAARIQAVPLSLAPHVPTLYGQALTPEHLQTLLWQAPQALRWMAAQRLAQAGHPFIHTRAHARHQQTQLPQPQQPLAA
jgi:hypothetical protein